MGLLKAWKEAKAVAASVTAASGAATSGTGAGRAAPRHTPGMAAGFGAAMLKMMGPLLQCEAPERGDPFPDTEPGVLTAQEPAALQAGVGALTARDSAFDPQTLTAFADQVFAAWAAAWGSGDPASVRPVLADALWDPMAGAMTIAAAGAGAMFAHQVGRSTISGIWAGSSYDSALFDVAVSMDVPVGPGAGMPPGATNWNEDWLFQRSVTAGGDPMKLSESCPSCGAPTATDAFGLCSHCHEPIPVLTAGWLLTCVRSHNPMVELFMGQIVQQIRGNPAFLAEMPDDLVRLLPADVVAEVAPQRGGSPAPSPAMMRRPLPGN